MLRSTCKRARRHVGHDTSRRFGMSSNSSNSRERVRVFPSCACARTSRLSVNTEVRVPSPPPDGTCRHAHLNGPEFFGAPGLFAPRAIDSSRVACHANVSLRTRG